MCCAGQSLQKMTVRNLSARSYWRRKVVVYLQKHSVNSFYNLFSQILFTFNITAKYLQASRCMCAGGLPEIGTDKDGQLSHPLFLCWVALTWWWQGGFWSGLLCHLQPAASMLPSFCLWILLTWCSMNLRCFFFPTIMSIFPFWVSFHPLPLLEPGKGGRCGEAGVTCWFSSGKSPVLGLSWVLALWGYKQHLSQFYCC